MVKLFLNDLIVSVTTNMAILLINYGGEQKKSNQIMWSNNSDTSFCNRILKSENPYFELRHCKFLFNRQFFFKCSDKFLHLLQRILR